jgi:hypothetical protein
MESEIRFAAFSVSSPNDMGQRHRCDGGSVFTKYWVLTMARRKFNIVRDALNQPRFPVALRNQAEKKLTIIDASGPIISAKISGELSKSEVSQMKAGGWLGRCQLFD